MASLSVYQNIASLRGLLYACLNRPQLIKYFVKHSFYKYNNMNKKISIITVVFNDKFGLEKTIESVISQKYKNIEYIVIDGNSVDGTIEIIKKYRDKITIWISEKDLGIYNAMNKGISYVTGQWVCFMNAGDVFVDNYVLDVISKYLNTNISYLYGKHIAYKNGKKILYNIPKIRIQNIKMPNHQSMFINANVMKELMYDEKYKYWADQDLKIKLYNIDKGLFVNHEITIYDMSGLSQNYSDMRVIIWKLKDCYRLLLLKRVNILGFTEILFNHVVKIIIYRIFGSDFLYKVQSIRNKYLNNN